MTQGCRGIPLEDDFEDIPECYIDSSTSYMISFNNGPTKENIDFLKKLGFRDIEILEEDKPAETIVLATLLDYSTNKLFEIYDAMFDNENLKVYRKAEKTDIAQF